ncbi:hypothetical protein [Pedobacter sp. Hv1]|uniref:hypothetical protein n=1 Tax=Pedobacter sp. Hv1 TaxID=1740090 RepID=UPI0006D8AEB6|nr:hypothetical protein [Pedobacter sp. Hv1]KQB99200.1 hypothetical protein AQF98_16610 [Pedobacter sp. Hv1]
MDDFIDWLSRYLGIDRNPTATIIVSVSVFCLGILINESLKAYGKYRERRAIREIVRRNYLIFKNYLFEQAENLKVFERQVSIKSSPNFNLYVNSCSALDNYREISYGNSFRAFFVGAENIRLRRNILKAQAFDNLYSSLSSIKIEQERMFPILARFQQDAAPIVTRLNLSMKDAFENIGDIYIKLKKQPPNTSFVDWLNQREKLDEDYLAKPNSKGIVMVKKYFIAILNFEEANAEPITQILDVKEFWNYHHKIQVAIGDIDSLRILVNSTKQCCSTMSNKFCQTGENLASFYQPLFNRKLK